MGSRVRYLPLHGWGKNLGLAGVATSVDTVDTVEGVCNGFLPYTRFLGSLSSLDITNGNRSHNKPLELI